MRLGRSTNTDGTLSSAAMAVQNGGILKGEGDAVRGPKGTTVIMNGPIGTARTATVTDDASGKVIGTVEVNENCNVTGIQPAR